MYTLPSPAGQKPSWIAGPTIGATQQNESVKAIRSTLWWMAGGAIVGAFGAAAAGVAFGTGFDATVFATVGAAAGAMMGNMISATL